MRPTKNPITNREGVTGKCCTMCGIWSPLEDYPCRSVKDDGSGGYRFAWCEPCDKKRAKRNMRAMRFAVAELKRKHEAEYRELLAKHKAQYVDAHAKEVA